MPKQTKLLYYGELVFDRSVANGVEYVSHIITPEELPLAMVEAYSLGLPTDENCGMHLHISRQHLTNKKLRGLVKQMSSLSMIEFEELFGRQPNKYCKMLDLKWLQSINKEGRFFNSDRFYCLNLANVETIEIRGWCAYKTPEQATEKLLNILKGI